MRVLFISPTGTLDNGAEISIVNLMKFLKKNGITVHNVFPENQHPTYQDYLDTMKEWDIVAHPLSTYQWWWKDAPNSISDREDLVALFYQKNVSDIRRIIREEGIELVISNTINTFQGAVAAACEEVRHFYLIHEFPFGEFAYYKNKIDFIDSHSDAIYAVKGQLFDNLVSYFPEEKMGEFIPYSDAAICDITIGQKQRILSIGKLTERKNQLELIQAYHKLERPDLPLVFIGGWDEDYKKKCDQYISKHQLTNVTFMGHQPEPWKLATDKDLCVFTSQLEAFPLVCTEAMLNGLPTILSNNLGHLSIHNIFQTGLFYSLGDQFALVDKMKEVLDNFSVFKEEAQLSKERIRNFYQMENTYAALKQTILRGKAPKKKPTQDLASLLDFSTKNQYLEFVLQKKVTIYTAKVNQAFSEDNKRTYPLKENGRIDFPIEEGVTEIRIDLSELPSIYSEVKVTTVNGKQILFPIETNGLSHENGYLFLEGDPYLVFQVKDLCGDNLCLEYKSSMIGNVMSSESSSYLSSLRKRIQEIEQLEKDSRELGVLRQEYQAIISSRRWTIPTRIINFFRRRK